MFVETVTLPRDEWDRWTEPLRTSTDPPEGLIASIAWQTGDGAVTAVNLWDSPEAVADFFVARIHPLIQASGEPSAKPVRHGEPTAVFIREGPVSS